MRATAVHMFSADNGVPAVSIKKRLRRNATVYCKKQTLEKLKIQHWLIIDQSDHPPYREASVWIELSSKFEVWFLGKKLRGRHVRNSSLTLTCNCSVLVI